MIDQLAKIQAMKWQGNEIDKLRKRVAELEAVNTWISVNDRLPESMQGVKILGYNGDYAFECEFDDGAWCNIGGESFTYWMPLPENPTDKEVCDE